MSGIINQTPVFILVNLVDFYSRLCYNLVKLTAEGMKQIMGLITKLVTTAATKSVIKTIGKTTAETAVAVTSAVSKANANKQNQQNVINNQDSIVTQNNTIAKVTSPNISHFIGGHYLKARAAFIAAGFVDISFIEKKDLTKGWLNKDGDVVEISIGGKTNIKNNEKFTPNIPVVIVYHTYKDSTSTTPTSNIYSTQNFIPINNSHSIENYNSVQNLSTTQNTTSAPNINPNQNDFSINNYKSTQNSNHIFNSPNQPQTNYPPTQSSTMYCPTCGTKQNKSNRFCLSCGFKLHN